MSTKFPTPLNFSNDFIIDDNGLIHKRLNISKYYCNWGSGYQAANSGNEQERRLCTIADSLGIIHLDFIKTSSNNGYVATLPANCPTPLSLIEVQTWDGGNIWIDGGSRNIACGGLSTNRRYIVDLLGFFRI